LPTHTHRVADEDPSSQTLILTGSDLSRLRNSAHMMTRAERQTMTDSLKAQKKDMMVSRGEKEGGRDY